ncbi:MAG TPA: pitrilysin family protein [Alphaproteobacteria bacterium]|nr:pitrilysin family protein [Alphaproteobacteria bacterium]
MGRALRLLSCLLITGMLFANSTEARVFDPTSYVLPNGLQLVIVENHSAPIATHMVWYRVGAADEPWGKSGIAHFLEHLMFKGTKTHPPGEFSRIVARNGGSENAFTSQDTTAYFQSVAVDRLELVMGLEADRMANLVLIDDVVLPERDVVLEERRQRIENDPPAKLGEMATAAFYLNHPYREPIIGWEHEIRSLTTEDALDFYKSWYAPNNAVVIVAGDVTAEAVKAMAERTYGKIAARPLPERARPQEPQAYAPRRVVLESAQVRQPSWSRRWLAPSHGSGGGARVYALQILSEILGGSTVSRLYRNLAVERGIATDSGSAYSPDSLDPTGFVVWASPRQGGDLKEIETAVEAVIAELVKTGVTEEEVARAKQQLQDRAVLARDNLETAPQIIGSALMAGRDIEELEAWPERIGEVTVAQVNEAARMLSRPEVTVTSELRPKPTS